MGNQRPFEWGQKCRTMPNFISWGLGMSPCNISMQDQQIQQEVTESPSLAFIGQIWDKIQPSMHFLVHSQAFEWLYLVIQPDQN